MALSNCRALLADTPLAPMVFQLLPLNHCQTPSLLALTLLANTATPAKVLAAEPPLTWSFASLKLPPNRAATDAPGGLALPSFTAVKLALPLSRVGASFTAVTCTLLVPLRLLNAVLAPVVVTSADVPAVPLL